MTVAYIITENCLVTFMRLWRKKIFGYASNVADTFTYTVSFAVCIFWFTAYLLSILKMPTFALHFLTSSFIIFLVCAARNCMRLQVLELDHVSEINQEVAAEVCREGLKGLEMLVLTSTPVTPKALLHFNSEFKNFLHTNVWANWSYGNQRVWRKDL